MSLLATGALAPAYVNSEVSLILEKKCVLPPPCTKSTCRGPSCGLVKFRCSKKGMKVECRPTVTLVWTGQEFSKGKKCVCKEQWRLGTY